LDYALFKQTAHFVQTADTLKIGPGVIAWIKWTYYMLCIVYKLCCWYSVSRKKRPKCFFVISSIKLGWFRWMVYRFLNKFTAKSSKRFSPHLNNVSALPCETWNAR